jgi:hypothetical protein
VDSYLHALSLNPVFGFMGLMVEGFLRHCVLFTSALVVFTTKGHEMGSPVFTRPCLHLRVVVV